MNIVKERLNESIFKGPDEEEVADNFVERAGNYFGAYSMANYYELDNIAKIIKRKIFEDSSPLSKLAEEIWDKALMTPDMHGRCMLTEKQSRDVFKIICENNFKSKIPDRTFNSSDKKYSEYITNSDLYLSKIRRDIFLEFRVPIYGYPMNSWAAQWLEEYMPSIKVKDMGRDNYDLIIKENTSLKGEMNAHDEGRINVIYKGGTSDISSSLAHLSFPQFIEFARYILNNKPSEDFSIYLNLADDFQEKEFNHVPEDFANKEGKILFRFSDELINKVLEYFK